MNAERQAPDLLARTKAFSLAVIRFYSGIPRETAAQVLGRQLLRSATSVGAQYREAQRAKSTADFISKTEGALQELDETAYWLELINDSGMDHSGAVADLQTETEQLLSIFVSITRTAKRNARLKDEGRRMKGKTFSLRTFRLPPSAFRLTALQSAPRWRRLRSPRDRDRLQPAGPIHL